LKNILFKFDDNKVLAPQRYYIESQVKNKEVTFYFHQKFVDF